MAMKKALLLFPDSMSMADFLIKEKISHAEVNSNEQTLIAPLDDKQIVRAETVYSAIFKTMIPHN